MQDNILLPCAIVAAPWAKPYEIMQQNFRLQYLLGFPGLDAATVR